MPYQYVPGYQPYPYQPPMPDQLAQLRGAQYQPMPQQMPQAQPQQVQAGGQSMVWVSGESEAMAYLVAPNSAVALWDSNTPTIYLKQADASGKPSIKVYDLVERTSGARTAQAPQGVEFATKADLAALAARVDALEMHVFNILQFQVTNSGLDIVIVLFIVHFQRFSREPFWLLVELQPLLIPSVDGHGAAYGFLTALCGGQLVR